MSKHRSALRGGPLERGLQRVIRDVALGSLLIQTDPESGEPMLLHSMLPTCVKLRYLATQQWVFLLDAQVSESCQSQFYTSLSYTDRDCSCGDDGYSGSSRSRRP